MKNSVYSISVFLPPLLTTTKSFFKTNSKPAQPGHSKSCLQMFISFRHCYITFRHTNLFNNIRAF